MRRVKNSASLPFIVKRECNTRHVQTSEFLSFGGIEDVRASLKGEWRFSKMFLDVLSFCFSKGISFEETRLRKVLPLSAP